MKVNKVQKSPKVPPYRMLGFESKKVRNKFGRLQYLAVCLKCSAELTNTSIARMEQHRDCCSGAKKKSPENQSEQPTVFYESNENEPKAGRHRSKSYKQLGFKPGQVHTVNGSIRSVAQCLVCDKIVHNTSGMRLVTHRKNCHSEEFPFLKANKDTELRVHSSKGNLDVPEEKNKKEENKHDASEESTEETDNTDQPETENSSQKPTSTFEKFYGDLGYRFGRFKCKSGVIRHGLTCLVCYRRMLHITRRRLIDHRRTCNSKEHQYSPEKIKLAKSPRKGKAGRSRAKLYDLLGFRSARVRNKNGVLKNAAFCVVCDAKVANTSGSRLISHRKSCPSDQYKYTDLPTKEKLDIPLLKLMYDLQHGDGENNGSPEHKTQIDEPKDSDDAFVEKKAKRPGRNPSELYNQLGYTVDTIVTASGTVKSTAICSVCDVRLMNTSGSRLLTHRRVCYSEKFSSFPQSEEIVIETVDCKEEEENIDLEEKHLVLKESVPTKKNFSVKRKRKVSPDLDTTEASSSISDVKEAVANLVYGCSLPFSITESVHFKRLIRTLDATCLTDLPSRHELSINLMNTTYRKCLEETRTIWHHKEAPLVLDTIETKAGPKFFVSALQDGISGTRAFVNCLELKSDVDEDECFNKMATQSVELAKYLYNTEVYAIVTDRIIRNEEPENFGNVWYLPCHRFLASLLLQDLLETIDFKTCLFRVKIIVDKLRRVEINKPLTYRSMELGSEIDSLYFLVDNWDTFEQAVSSNPLESLSMDVKLSFYNMDFKDSCVGCIDKIEFLSGFVKRISSKTFSLAESLVLWHNFMKDPMVQEQRSGDVLKCLVEERIKETKSIYSLVTHYFGEGRNFTSREHTKIKTFLEKVLSEEAFKEYESLENYEFPSVLDRDDYYRSTDFWEMMKKDVPNFAEFALQMLKIPGTTGNLKHILKDFSNNSSYDNEEHVRKLMFVYFRLKVKEIDL